MGTFALKAIVTGMAAVAAFAGTASAGGSLAFRGVDINPNGVVPMASTPNATAARTSFLSALTEGFAVNDVESVPLGSSPSVLEFGSGLSATVSGAQFAIRNTPQFGAHGVIGPRFVYTEASEQQTLLSLVFNAPVTALGFWHTDATDWLGTSGIPQLAAQVRLPSGDFESINLTTTATNTIRDASTGFFGIVTPFAFTEFRVFRLSGGGNTDAVGFDGFIAVPTPGAAGLTLVGVASMARRRRR
jgi:hypothetical protein